MATPPYNLDVTSPQLTDFADAFPANERTFRDAVNSWLSQIADATSGYSFVTVGDSAALAALNLPPTGMQFYNTDTGSTDLNTGTPGSPVWVQQGPSIPAGSKVVFFQAAAPVGWTQDASANDAVLRMVSGTGGGSGGSWTISGGSVTVATHAISVAEMPVHHHSLTAYHAVATTNYTNSGAIGIASESFNTGDTGNGDAHGHAGSSLSFDGTWRPAYINVIACVKN